MQPSKMGQLIKASTLSLLMLSMTCPPRPFALSFAISLSGARRLSRSESIPVCGSHDERSTTGGALRRVR